jgi:hypothetical protein
VPTRGSSVSNASMGGSRRLGVPRRWRLATTPPDRRGHPPGCPRRRQHPDLADLQPFGRALHGADVEVVEAKRELNTAVIGQLLCGLSMFSVEYPSHGRVTLTALVNRAPDAAVRWYCQVERIQIVELDPVWMTGDG